MNEKWNGQERRLNSRDHDTLIELVQILNNHVQNFDRHVTDDKENFINIGKKVDNHSRYIYMALGGIALIEIIFGIHK